MSRDFLPLCRPSINEDDIQAVSEVLRSGWITTGKVAAVFERELCRKVEAVHGIAVSSATAGMHLVLQALGITSGDEVITPSMTWVSTVNLITLIGAVPVFADIDRDTLMVTAETVEQVISDKTKLVIPVHYAGAACDLDAIQELCDNHGVPMIQDAAHALGTLYRGRPTGSRGTSIFSFHPIKNITSGEGGMVTTDDEALADRIRRLKFHGLGMDAFDRMVQGRTPHAEVLEPGYKYNLPDMAAALGLSQLKRLDSLNAARRSLTKRYYELLADIDEILPLKKPEKLEWHACHLMVVRLDTDKAGINRDEFMEALKRKNIGSGIHFIAAHQHSYYRKHYPGNVGNLPQTDWNSERILSLPLFPDMTLEDVDYVVHSIKEVLSTR